jgi:hypothetical protein
MKKKKKNKNNGCFGKKAIIEITEIEQCTECKKPFDFFDFIYRHKNYKGELCLDCFNKLSVKLFSLRVLRLSIWQ